MYGVRPQLSTYPENPPDKQKQMAAPDQSSYYQSFALVCRARGCDRRLRDHASRHGVHPRESHAGVAASKQRPRDGNDYFTPRDGQSRLSVIVAVGEKAVLLNWLVVYSRERALVIVFPSRLVFSFWESEMIGAS